MEHVLIFPVPAQGHVNSMLNLAELLAFSGLTIPDGLPVDHPRSGESIREVFESLRTKCKPIFRDMLVNAKPPVSCIIGDGILGFVVEVAKELEIPIIQFRTVSACCFWAYFCVPEMIEAGELPLKGDQDMDSLIKTVPGMETFLRYRDLPSFCHTRDLSDKNFQLLNVETRRSQQTDGLIFNTFDDLESPILAHIQKHCPKVYTIGPLHLHHKTRITQQSSTKSNSLMAVDRSCITWLDDQPFVESAANMARLARSAVSEGGSSFCNLESLIEDIKSMARTKT
ncbi:hypothetical protein ACFE04_029975 [Oxalis oulophora]